MITYYLHFIVDFWYSSALKLVEWVSESLFVTKKRFVMMKSKVDELELGLGSVRFTRGLGRKRILISSSVRKSAVEIPVTGSLKRQRSSTIVSSSSSLESLPPELLIRVICGVDHEDLMSLYLVSKSIKEASVEAKRLHFAFTTPKKIRAFRNPIEISSHQEEELEPPNAPNHNRWTKGKRNEQLSSVSMALFT